MDLREVDFNKVFEFPTIQTYRCKGVEFKIEPRGKCRDEAVAILGLWIEELENSIEMAERFLRTYQVGDEDSLHKKHKASLRKKKAKHEELENLEEEWLSQAEDWEIDVIPAELEMLLEWRIVSPELVPVLIMYNPFGDPHNLEALIQMLEHLSCYASHNAA